MLSLSISLIAFTQNNSFPKDFIGNWKGTLTWTQLGKKEPQKVSMELRIQPSKDSANQYTWNLIYGSPSQDNRPYLLKSIDTANEHWIIDELNGIILDQYWLTNRFTGAFTVMTSTIVNSYWLDGKNLHVEFISYTSKPIATTGKGNDESPMVDSYGIKSYQKAILTKQ